MVIRYARLNCGDYIVKINNVAQIVKNIEEFKQKYPTATFEEVSKMEI